MKNIGWSKNLATFCEPGLVELSCWLWFPWYFVPELVSALLHYWGCYITSHNLTVRGSSLQNPEVAFLDLVLRYQWYSSRMMALYHFAVWVFFCTNQRLHYCTWWPKPNKCNMWSQHKTYRELHEGQPARNGHTFNGMYTQGAQNRAVAFSGPGEGVVLSGYDTKVYLKLALGSISGICCSFIPHHWMCIIVIYHCIFWGAYMLASLL